MKISIALCTYNGSKYLINQLESLKNQILQADEIVVCDDGSTDNTIEILNRYKDILNIKIFINEVNLGVTKNFEKAISLCTGDIIFLCDQDDIWEKDKIEKMSKIFDDKNIGLVLCNGIIIDKNDKQIKNYTLWNSFGIDKIDRENFNVYALIDKNLFTGMAMAFRDNLKKYILPISKNAVHDEWIGIIGSYFSKVFFMQKCLVNYRIHKNQQIGVYSVLSLREKYKSLNKYKISKINQELDKVKDLIIRLTELDANEKLINKLKKKQKFFEHRITTNKFRFFILFWQFITFKYYLYTNGKFKTFIRDIFSS